MTAGPDDRLPNLLIAGVEKAGTTSLFEYLSQHPDICASLIKEVSYFRPLRHNLPLAPLDEYRKHFTHCEGQAYLMDASPSYAPAGRPVIDAIRRTLGRPRVIISLRDPAQRLWSAYTFQRMKGRLRNVKDLEDFIDACEWQRGHDEIDPRIGIRLLALSVGFYADYLGQWLDEFGEDLRIVFAEDLFEDPDAVVSALCRWLGIDPEAVTSFRYERRNRTVRPRSARLGRMAYQGRSVTQRLLRRQPRVRAALRRVYFGLNSAEQDEVFSADSRRRLDEIYRESNAALAAMLAQAGYRDLPAWLQRARQST